MAPLRILLQGLGGIGGVVAARLLRAGYGPTLVTGNAEITAAIKQEGLRVKTLSEEFTVAAEAYTDLAHLPKDSRFDVSIMLMKANPVVAAAQKTLPFLAEDGYLLTCQNGMVEDAVAAVVGRQRVLAGIVGWGGTMHAPAVVEKTGPGAIHLGELDGSHSPRVRALASVLRYVSPVVVSGNIVGAMWAKLAINCMITAMGALTGQTMGQMLRQKRARLAFLNIYREVVDTAEALGVKLERIAVHPRLLYVAKNAAWPTRLVKDSIARAIGLKYRRLKSSALQSLQRGRPTEIDFLNGYVAARAQETKIAVPFNRAVTRLIKEIEAGERQIHVDNIRDLFAAAQSYTET